MRRFMSLIAALALISVTLFPAMPTWASIGDNHFRFDTHGGARFHLGFGHGLHNYRFDHFHSRKFDFHPHKLHHRRFFRDRHFFPPHHKKFFRGPRFLPHHRRRFHRAVQ